MIDLDMAGSATQAVAGDGAVADVDGFDDLIDARDVFAFVLKQAVMDR